MIASVGSIVFLRIVFNMDLGTKCKMISVAWKDEHESGTFHALPYELAHPVVKALCAHISAFREAKNDQKAWEEKEPGTSKAKKAKKAVDDLLDVKRYIILNRRTGWPATSEWMSRHIAVGPSGKPELKNGKSKANPWILSVRIKLTGVHAEIWMQPSESKAFRSVRCLSLSDGQLKTEFAQLMDGYDHILQEHECLLRFVVFYGNRYGTCSLSDVITVLFQACSLGRLSIEQEWEGHS